jgi:asparagine synthase (glutamine-hydrolysing)
MCGIGGTARAGGSKAESLHGPLLAMEASMIHRGPDDGGALVFDLEGGGAVGLCARRLAIQDLSSRGHQPMHSRLSRSWGCLNGEVYNVNEVRAELAARGHYFCGHSDTEVVLAAYDEWGPECFGRLRGMLAVAIWDTPQRRLVLARDRLGIKPLYYTEGKGKLAFASEVGALLSSGLVPTSLSPEGLRPYLALGAVEEPGAIVKDVRALAGHYGIWDGRTLRLSEYWSLADSFAQRDPPAWEDAVPRVRAGLEDAVRRHLVSDVPLGVFLSGGIDSSALVGLVTAVADHPPQLVSVVFPQKRWSEEDYIRMVTERFGTSHTQVVLTDVDILAQLPMALSAMDQPTFDGVNTYIVSRQARAAGLTVALSGVGSDELFAGYDTFRIVRRLNRLRRLPGAPARPAAAAVVRAALQDSDRGRKLARWLRAAEPALSATALRRELFGPDAIASLLGGPQPQATGKERAPHTADETDRVSFLELDRYMRNVLLRDTDVLGMAHGLEVRVLFLDHEPRRNCGRAARLPQDQQVGAEAFTRRRRRRPAAGRGGAPAQDGVHPAVFRLASRHPAR